MNSVILAALLALVAAFCVLAGGLATIGLIIAYQALKTSETVPAKNLPVPALEPRFMMSGVWGKNAYGETVDLRIHNPRLAYRLLGCRPVRWQRIEESTSADGQVIYTVEQLVVA